MALELRDPNKKDWPKHKALEEYCNSIKDTPPDKLTPDQIDTFFQKVSDALGELVPELKEA